MIESDDQFDIAIIDADSILYQIAHMQPSPALCRKALDDKLKEIMTNTGSIGGAVFIKGKDNFRYQVDAAYKGNRKDTIEPEVKDRIEELYEYSKDFAIQSDNGEADDYCGIAAELALQDNKRYVVCHIDKDLDCIPGWHYNFRKDTMYYVEPEDGYRFLMMQVLTGDATDNIQGLRGVGPKTAEKLINGVPNNLLWQKVIDIWKEKCGDNWEPLFLKCANCIYIRETDDDLKPLSLEELKERLSWTTTTDTGTPSQTDQTTPLDSSTTSKTLKQGDDTLEESNS
jgi:5'-3' exonuclease